MFDSGNTVRGTEFKVPGVSLEGTGFGIPGVPVRVSCHRAVGFNSPGVPVSRTGINIISVPMWDEIAFGVFGMGYWA